MARRKPVCYAYQTTQGGVTTLSVLPTCSSLRSLLRQTPADAVPGYYDERDDTFRPLAGRAVA